MKHLNDNELVLALDGEMNEAELKQAVDHMAECDDCRQRWEKLQRLSARVVEYSASLYEKTLAADARRLTLIESPKRFRFPVWSWGLVAAVVLVGVSMGVWDAYHLPHAHPIAQNPRDKDGAQIPTIGVTPTAPTQLAVDSHPSLGMRPAQSGAKVRAVKSSNSTA